ncbi:sigma-70 family RNA polymerase sigma factor [bacterium]|nr:MAG: sigma-70 family RNA polymerase sigma factor [bacterium]
MNEDDALMERAKAGDTAAFDAIVRRHQHRLQRFAIRMAGGDAARGADVAVGAFLRLWERRHAYQPQGKLGAWLLQTVYRMLVDESRRDLPQAEIHETLDASEGPHARLERTALAQAVRDAVTALPEPHRAVLVLSVYEGLTQAEVAEVLDVPPGTVASRKSYALETLRRRLSAWSEL